MNRRAFLTTLLAVPLAPVLPRAIPFHNQVAATGLWSAVQRTKEAMWYGGAAGSGKLMMMHPTQLKYYEDLLKGIS